MDRLAALSAYARTYMAKATRLATYRDAREWMEKTGIGPDDAATLANKGYTPDEVAARAEAAYDTGDERDSDRVIDAMLYGPDVDR